MKKTTIIFISILLLLVLFSSEIQNTVTGEFLWFWGKEKKETKDDPTISTEQNLIKINKKFTKNLEYPITYKDKISHLSLNGDIKLEKDNSYVRVILKDQNNKEFLILESNALFNDKKYSFTNECEETCDIEAVNIKSLVIELSDASIDIKSINLEKGIIETGEIAKRSADIRKEKLKDKQKEKIDTLNKRIKEKGMNWIAGETWVSRLSYEGKKRLFAKPDGTPVDRLPNLQGFEYYKGGVFEIIPQSEDSITGKIIEIITSKVINKITSKIITKTIPSNWDWRNVHGENWLTSVKNQGGVGTCWAFALIGTMEAQINLYYNQHLDVDLSEQHIVDCVGEPNLPMGMGSILYPECSGENMCYPGVNYCVIAEHGISDEACDPYAERNLYSSHCDLTHICDDWKNRVWKVSDFHDYKFFLDFGTPNCPKHTIGLNEEELKQILIEKGPVNSAVLSWSHAMVLVGYEIDLSDGRTIWIFKNSWGTGYGESGYVKLKATLEDLGWASLPIGPFIPPSDSSYWPSNLDVEISCVDNDNDNYCYWGISESKPDSCPSFCKSEKDPDDSDANILYTREPMCIDSDGSNYYVKGEATSGVGGTKDCCKNQFSTNMGDVLKHIGPGGGPCVSEGKYLYEAICGTDGVPTMTVYECPFGCKDGVCIKEELKCMDSDGLDWYTKGVCMDTNYPEGIWDKCATFESGGYVIDESESYVIEYHCRAGIEDYSCQARYIDCSHIGFICLDGACVEEIFKCTETDTGKDYFVKGITSANAYREFDHGTFTTETIKDFEDYCCYKDNCYRGPTETSNILAERWCKDGIAHITQYTCPNGCQDGACIQDVEKQFMEVSDVVIVEGKQVTLSNVGSDGSVMVDVEGTMVVIPAFATEIINGLEITNVETFYEDRKEDRSANLKIALI